MNFSGNRVKRRTGAFALALALLGTGGALSAQSVSDFRLPPPSPTATPTKRAPGPVDTDAPEVRTRPTATPSPATVQPVTQPTATPTAAPAARPTQAAPRPVATQAPRSLPSSAPRPTASVSPAPVAAGPLPSEEPTPIVLQTMEAPPSHTDGPIVLPWYWFAIPAGIVVLLVAGWFALRRRPAPTDDEEEQVYEAPQPVAPAVPLAATPPLRHTPPSPPAPPPAPVAEAAAEADPLALAFEARKLSASLVNTSLAYRLVIENRRSEPLTGLIIAGDMIAAHGSLPVEKQLATDGQPLELRHEIAELAPGEVRELTGELRLPLSSINPIRSGSSLLYVPIARLRVEGPGASVLAAWVVGEAPQKAGGGLQPFRLDLGPRVYAQISQRRLDLAA